MAILTPEKPTTRREYEWVEDPSAPFYEIIDGENREKEMGNLELWIAGKLQFRLEIYCEERDLGWVLHEPMLRMSSTGNCRRPDLAFISFARWPKENGIPPGAWNVAADLAVEVISPNEKFVEAIDKVREYFASGFGQVWQFFPHLQEVHIHESPTKVRILTLKEELTAESLFPGFRVPMSVLFPIYGMPKS